LQSIGHAIAKNFLAIAIAIDPNPCVSLRKWQKQ